MKTLEQRRQHYGKIASNLVCISNEHLLSLLTKSKPVHTGIGGTSVLIDIDNIPVFVKKIPLTDLEHHPQNKLSTANLFDLPLYYQYGVGSAGFGAWRELAAHITTTNWVITGECPHFPLLFHWRVLPNEPNDLNIKHWDDNEKYFHYWENSSAIRKRIEALNAASSHIALFLEYVPQNLQTWLKTEIKKDCHEAEKAIKFVERNLQATNAFMNNKGLMHFDAHFENILTDGELLYFSDFGLALSTQFELTQPEQDFLKNHIHYDEACAAVNLLHCIITTLFEDKQWEIQLREYINSKNEILTPTVNAIIRKHAPLALVMDTFFEQLQKESKLTPYPAILIKKLLKQ